MAKAALEEGRLIDSATWAVRNPGISMIAVHLDHSTHLRVQAKAKPHQATRRDAWCREKDMTAAEGYWKYRR